MKTASVRELRNHYTSVLDWVSAGEEVVITQRGKPIARLIPEKQARKPKVNWADSPEVKRDRTLEPALTGRQSAQILAESGGSW